MQAVILAAGRGTRLQKLTSTRSKAMMPIAGQAMIARVIEMLTAAGLREFIIVTHPQDAELRELFEAAPNVQLAFQAERRGAAHALSMAAPLIRADFLLTACDNLVSAKEAQAFVDHFLSTDAQKPAGLLALMRVPPEKIPSMGMVDWDGHLITRIVEKPPAGYVRSDVASMPLYCFQRRFLDYLPRLTPSIRGEYELQDAMQLMIAETQAVQGKMLSGRWTLTDAADLLELNLRFLGAGTQVYGQDLPASLKLRAPYLIEPGVEIGADCLIGPGVVIEARARIGNGAVLHHALVLRGAQVPAGEIVENKVFG